MQLALQHSWGLVSGPGIPWWVSNNAGGALATMPRPARGTTLFFTAGPNNETNGLFGTLTPIAAEKGEDDEL